MKKLLILLFALFVIGCSTQNKITVIQGDTGYMISGKDTTHLTQEEVNQTKLLLSKYDGHLENDLRNAVSDFYDGDIDIDTLGLPF